MNTSPWNKDRIIGPKRPLQISHIWESESGLNWKVKRAIWPCSTIGQDRLPGWGQSTRLLSEPMSMNHTGKDSSAGFLISFSYKQKTPDCDSGIVGRDVKCTCSSRAQFSPFIVQSLSGLCL